MLKNTFSRVNLYIGLILFIIIGVAFNNNKASYGYIPRIKRRKLSNFFVQPDDIEDSIFTELIKENLIQPVTYDLHQSHSVHTNTRNTPAPVQIKLSTLEKEIEKELEKEANQTTTTLNEGKNIVAMFFLLSSLLLQKGEESICQIP